MYTGENKIQRYDLEVILINVKSKIITFIEYIFHVWHNSDRLNAALNNTCLIPSLTERDVKELKTKMKQLQIAIRAKEETSV